LKKQEQTSKYNLRSTGLIWSLCKLPSKYQKQCALVSKSGQDGSCNKKLWCCISSIQVFVYYSVRYILRPFKSFSARKSYIFSTEKLLKGLKLLYKQVKMFLTAFESFSHGKKLLISHRKAMKSFLFSEWTATVEVNLIAVTLLLSDLGRCNKVNGKWYSSFFMFQS